ncbi:unnamed protein product [Ranitomeya imitator]|uniref:TRASH domain-containing protein n=1 Tax=Ranitomeya imitator TaxID=111125 RepID=A0ABN9LEU0_9NEOB|nr:unnamed protein product [Ranitomeya imitator]
MATGLKNVGHAFGGPTSSKTFQTTSVIVDDDDDVVFIEPVQVPQNVPTGALRSAGFSSTKENHRADLKSHSSSSKDLDISKSIISETIIIDDEEEPEPSRRVHDKNASTFTNRRLMDSNRSVNRDYPSSSSFSRNKPSAGLMSSGITTEPDSEIQIANVTTLDSGINSASDGHHQTSESRDMNLMITHVTSLQNPGMGEVPNGLQSNFGGHVPNFPPSLTSQTKSTSGPYNPGRINVGGDVFQNGESATHHTSDAWISQSASFPRNQQPGLDTMSPVASLPKQVLQSSSQQPSKAVKVTCANCKKPLQKGQTAYQRKGSTHLFCSTTCLSSFSQKPAPKKLCTMCKKDITTMKGTIVAQVDSSESFQEFCSTYCLSLYEDKQNSAKNQNKSRCTICGKLTEIRHEVSFKNMTHKLCSDHCFNRYRMANGLIMNCCEHCGEYLPSKGAGDNVLMVDGQWKRFCSPACLNEFKLILKDCYQTLDTLFFTQDSIFCSSSKWGSHGTISVRLAYLTITYQLELTAILLNTTCSDLDDSLVVHDCGGQRMNFNPILQPAARDSWLRDKLEIPDVIRAVSGIISFLYAPHFINSKGSIRVPMNTTI